MTNQQSLAKKKDVSFFYFFLVVLLFLSFLLAPEILNNLDTLKSKTSSKLLSIITGYATGIPEIDSMPQRSALIYSPNGVVDEGKEISVYVVAYPYINGLHKDMQKANNYEVKLSYDQNVLLYKFTENLVKNFEMKETTSTGKISINAMGKDPASDIFYFEPTKLLKVTFLATKVADKVPIKIDKIDILNSLSTSGSYTPLMDNIENVEIDVVEKGMSDFIKEYIESVPTYSGSYYWSKMLQKDKEEIIKAWKLSPKKSGDCVSNCAGKQCGTDGCGGFCGTLQGKCGGDKVCINNKCSCQPNCFGKICGDDGCGGLCYAKICAKEEVPGKLWKNWKEWYMYAIALILLAILISLGVVFRKRIKLKISGKLSGAGQATQQFTKQVTQEMRAPPTKETKSTTDAPIKQQAPIPCAPPQLVNYINQQIAKGVQEDKIKESLGRVGWKEETVEAGFKEIGK